MHSLFIIAIVLVAAFAVFTIVRQTSQLLYIESYHFHPAIRTKVKRKYPDLNDAQLDRVFDGLREYFHLCNRANRHWVAMPSQVVDDAWHEFILFTRSYQRFCGRAFGRYLHHTPAEAMTAPKRAQDGIKRAWRLACRKEKINSETPDRLPLLFALDGELGVPGGFVYALNCVPGGREYCASHIGCGGGCSGDWGGDGDSGDGGSDGGCSGGCGGGGGD